MSSKKTERLTSGNIEKGLAVVDERANKNNSKEVSSQDLFESLASLMNSTVEQIKDECCCYNVRKFMSNCAKVIVRYEMTEKELTACFHNSLQLGIGEIITSPTYLPLCKKIVEEKGYTDQRVGAIIDFPFGEGSLKSKTTEIKECKKLGVEGIIVMMPTLLFSSKKGKAFRKQVKKFSKAFKGDIGIGVSAAELSEDQIKDAVKVIDKSKLDGITFVFGDAEPYVIKEKLEYIKKHKTAKKIKILGNVETVEATKELFRAGIDKVLTPYADQIGVDLTERYETKNIRLV